MHGFTRTINWAVESVACHPDDAVTATFCLTTGDITRAQWPHDFALRYQILIGATLSMRLEVEINQPILSCSKKRCTPTSHWAMCAVHANRF